MVRPAGPAVPLEHMFQLKIEIFVPFLSEKKTTIFDKIRHLNAFLTRTGVDFDYTRLATKVCHAW